MNCRFDGSPSHDRSDPIWTPKLVEERLAEATAVLRRLPAQRRQGFFNTWPRYSYEFGDLVSQEPRQTPLPPPSPAAISRMEEALTWTIGLDPIDGRIAWLRAHNTPWKAICWKVGLQRSAANERWLYALCVIAMQLNRQPVPKSRSRRYVIERVRDFANNVQPTTTVAIAFAFCDVHMLHQPDVVAARVTMQG